MVKLNREDIEWIERGLSKGLSRLEMKQKLTKAGYSEEKIRLFEEGYDNLFDKNLKKEKEEVVEEEGFEKKVKRYYKGEELDKQDMKDVERFCKEVKKYLKIWKGATEDIQKSIDNFKIDLESQDKDIKVKIEDLRGEMIDRLLESTILLEVEDPNTNLKITKGSLKDCSTRQLLKLMQENVEEMENLINGKTTERLEEVNNE